MTMQSRFVRRDLAPRMIVDHGWRPVRDARGRLELREVRGRVEVLLERPCRMSPLGGLARWFGARLTRVACALDPWLGHRDWLPTSWMVEQRWPWWRRVPQTGAVLRGAFLVRLNLWPWPMAFGHAVAAAWEYLTTGRGFGASLPTVEAERGRT